LEREKALKSILNKVQTIIDQLSANISSHEGRMKSQINSIVLEIRGAFHELDMTLEQEDYFTKVIEKNLHEMDSAEDGLSDASAALKALASQIINALK